MSLGLGLGLGVNLTPVVGALVGSPSAAPSPAMAYGASSHTGQFIGCSTAAGPTSMSAVTSNPYDACNTACSSYKYSFTATPQYDGDSVACTCSNSLSDTSSNWASSSGTTCAAGVYTVQDVSTPYLYQSCYDKATMDSTSWPTEQPNECYDTCNSRHQPYTFTSQTSSGAWQCGCGSTAPSSSSSTSTCSVANTYRAYYSTSTTTPSASQDSRKKRKERERRAKERAKVEQLCPAGLLACRIQGVDGYECVDVSSELESCGGCRFGIYTTLRTPPTPKDAREGINCSSLPGTRLGGMTCASGQCLAFACKKGWRLENDKCIRAVGRLRRT